MEQDNKFLQNIEKIGNKLPSIAILFLYGIFILWGVSFILSFMSFDYIHPTTKAPIQIINMLAPERLIELLTVMVKNYALFPPLAMTVVVTLGVGLAEGSGFLNTAIHKLMSKTSPKMLTPTVIFVSVFSNIISDSAYVILMPLASLMFFLGGRHPVAGIAASFAGLAGGFSASYFPTSMDPIMQGFSQSAAHIIDPEYHFNVLGNYFFSVSSTFAVIGACWFVTDKIVEPRLLKTLPITISENEKLALTSNNEITPLQHKAFSYALLSIIAIVVGVALLCIPENSLFRAPNGSLTSSKAPLMQGIVPLIFFIFAIPGLVYGRITGVFKDSKDVTAAMTKVISVLSGFLVFSFFCAQFLYIFAQSNIGILIAISGAEALKNLNMPPQFTIFGIILLTSMLNLLITSASSKWAILAPIFIPMLMGVGIAPELTQAAFRLSDASMNVTTPMFAFYPLIISYCQKYSKDTGVGTLCSTMLPYSITLLIVLTTCLFIFWGFGFPLGIDSSYVYPKI